MKNTFTMTFRNVLRTATALFTAAFLSLSAAAFAKEAVYESDEYNILVKYNETSCPGDAIYVRLNFSQNNRRSRITKEQFNATKATLSLYNGDTRIRKAEFFEIPTITAKGRSERTLLAGVPLSSWWTPETQDSLRINISYKLYGDQTYNFDLPFTLTPKEFVSETIKLDASNTAIKSDTSTTRMRQIDRLNSLLANFDSQAVYHTGAYKFPTEYLDRTSFFADRRIYAYNNGQSTTGLHFGIDFAAPQGSQVTACADGLVVMAENRISTGWSVVIEHLPGLYSLYYHMSELNVEVGQLVSQGELLGLSGSTGLSTAPHLHWEMRLNGEAVSPDFFLGNFTFEDMPK